MLRLRRFLLLLVLAGVVLGCDQAAKSLARSVLSEGRSVDLVNGTIRLQAVVNRGGFLGLGSGLPRGMRRVAFTLAVPFLLVMAAVVGSAMGETVTGFLGLVLFVGGGAGNLLDRLLRSGEVLDWVVLQLGSMHTGVFNLADVAILLGATLVAVDGVRRRLASSERVASE